MERDYDKTIERHYEAIARKHGLASTSTMADEQTRDLETHAIIRFAGESLRLRGQAGLGGKATIMDVGCGNGHTLSVLREHHPDQRFIGIEKSEALRALAVSRFRNDPEVEIREGDIRDANFAADDTVDVLICQRVLINLLSIEDQRVALNNVISAVKSPIALRAGGTLLFLESFEGPLTRLNLARSEFDLAPIRPADHNLYLPDDFFGDPRLSPLRTDGLGTPENFLSTHYYVTRVLHAHYTHDRPFKRNSEFVRFFSSALNQNVGDYSPLKLFVFEKTDRR